MKLKRIFAALITVAMLLAAVPGGVAAADGVGGEFISCTYYGGEVHKTTMPIPEDCTVVTENMGEKWSSGWYVVKDNVTLRNHPYFEGEIHLILMDGAELNAGYGITVYSEGSLYIYAQSEEAETMGRLKAKGGSAGQPGIGGAAGICGRITINGGNIEAIGYKSGPEIGNGMDSNDYSHNGNVTINGGIVDAYGGNNGAGIGGGKNGKGIHLQINGGTVTASGSGGDVRAIGPGAGGTEPGSMTVTGGLVRADLAENLYPTNEAGEAVESVIFMLDGMTKQTGIDSVNGINYGANGMFTFAGKELWLYLTQEDKGKVTGVTTRNGQVFSRKNAGDYTLYCTHATTQNNSCVHCGYYMDKKEPAKDVNGIYQISELSHLAWFCDSVNGGNTGAGAVLTRDINAKAAPALKIGTSGNPYSGTFDGNGHRIDVALKSFGNQYTALFAYVNGAAIKNLSIGGTVETSEKFGASFIGCVSGGNVKLEKCLSFADITTSVEGDGSHGGLVSNVQKGSLTIDSCGFLGSIKGAKTTNCGGFVGWTAVNTKILDSFVAADFDLSGDENSNTFSRNPNKVDMDNCYYLKALGSVPDGAAQISAEQITSGELTYKLNGSVGGGSKWYQNVDNGKSDNGKSDKNPVTDSTHGKIYYGYADCDAAAPIYSNTKIAKTEKGHVGGTADCLSPGYCTDCGAAYIPIDKETHRTTETHYEFIDNEHHGLYHSCCGALIEKGDHSGTEATCTGVAHCDTCDTSYGSIDKTNHAEGGELIYEDTGYATHVHKWTCCGFVESTEEHDISCTVNTLQRSITVSCSLCGANGTVKLNAQDKTYDGQAYTADYTTTGFMSNWRKPVSISFEYCCEGGCKKAGVHRVIMTVGDKELGTNFEIKQRELTVSEVRAENKSYDATNAVSVRNILLNNVVVYSKGEYASFDVKDNVGVDLGKVTVTTDSAEPGSYTTANLTGLTLIGDDKANYTIKENPGTVKIRCEYWDSYDISQGMIYITPEDQNLSGDSELDQTAYTVDSLDEKFVLSGIKLYVNQYNGKISVDIGEATVTYNGDDVTDKFTLWTYEANLSRVCQGHKFGDDGFCASGKCDSYQAATLITEENCVDFDLTEKAVGSYAISNAGQLYWFADRVNNYNENYISAVLVNDITVNKNVDAGNAESLRKWTPIGKASLSYVAAFDGQGHTVSGLYFKDNTAEYVGLFGKTDYNYNIKNINISDSYFEGARYVGALAGSAASVISECTADDTVTVVGEENVGGLVGVGADGELKNCMSTASVPKSDKFMGGLVGDNYSKIENCYTTASNLAGYTHKDRGSVTNSYYLAETDDGEGGKTAEQFENGEVAYLLQSGVKGDLVGYDSADQEMYGEAPQVWGQKIGKDKLPVYSDDAVYEDTYDSTKAYRNKIRGFEVLYLGADKKSATVVLNGKGAYTIVFADYDAGRLSGVKTFEVSVEKAQAVRVASTENFTLGTGDKVMIWSSPLGLAPKCNAYEVK